MWLSPKCRDWICWSLEGLNWSCREDRSCPLAIWQCQASSVELAEWCCEQAWLSLTKSILLVHTKGLARPWKVVKKRPFPLCTLFPIALPLLATPMETNRSCLLAQGTVRDYLGAYFYPISFIPAWKQALIRSCFENTLTDKCRTIQGESVGGDTFLRMAESICLSLFAEWKDYRINQCLPASEACSSLSAHLPHQFLFFLWFLSYRLSCRWQFL